MKFDMKGWKKIASHPDHTVLRNPAGHEVKVAHKPLSPKLRGELESIPLHSDTPKVKMAGGGKVADKSDDLMSSDDPQAARAAQGFEQLEAPIAKKAAENVDKDVAQYKQAGSALKSGDTSLINKMADEKGMQAAEGTVGFGAGSEPVMGVAKDIAAKGPQAIQEALAALDKANISPSHPAYQILAKMMNQSKGVKYAEGGEVSSPDDSQAAPQAPITINLGAIPQSMGGQGQTQNTGVPEQFVNPNPGAQALAKANPPQPAPAATQAPDLYGVDPEEYAKMQVAKQSTIDQAAKQKQQEQTVQVPGEQPQNMDPFGTGAAASAYEQGIGETEQAFKQQAQVEAARDQAKLGVYAQGIQKQQALADLNQQHLKQLNEETMAAIHDAAKGHINPNQYMESMDTPKRIQTAIGLLIGGLGGGQGSNPAMDYLQSQIQRDIEAQKANIGQKNNIVSAYQNQFGNERDATQMSLAVRNGIMANQLSAAALKAPDAAAQARLNAASGQFHMQAANMIGQMAMRKTLLSGMQRGAVAPEHIVNMLVPEPERKAASEQLQDAQRTVQARDNVLSAFDQLTKLNTVGNKITSPLQTPREVNAILMPLTASMSKGTAGRFTEADAHYLATQWPSMGDSAKTTAIKRAAINKLVSEKMKYPTLSHWGINVDDFGRYDQNGNDKFAGRSLIK